MSNTILFIDSKVTNYETLLAGLSGDVEVHILNAEKDGVLQMVDILKNRSGLDSIQIISHGSSGSLSLGSSILNNTNLLQYQNALTQIGSSLSATGDMLLYGCNVAQGDIGLQFINGLAQYTGADVAASDDLTGNTFAGADWVLEKTVGNIEAVGFVQNDVAGFGSNTLVTTAGIVITSFDETNLYDEYAEIRSVVVQSDGKILVAGGYNYNSPNADADFAVARYSSNGSLDNSFDGDGKLITDIQVPYGSVDIVSSMTTQADGKILVAGVTRYGGLASFALARYNLNGSLDTSFDIVDDDGIVVNIVGTSHSEAHDVIVQADRKILVVGSTLNPAGSSHDFALVRYNSNGSLDTSFDGDGKVTTDFKEPTEVGETHEAGNAVALQADGRILVAGFSYNGFALARYTSNGSLDTSFSGDGKVITTIAGGIEADCKDILIQSDGKILLAGDVKNSTSNNYDFALVRYNNDGSLDTSFSSDGIVKTNFLTGLDDHGYSVTLQTDGKILVVGTNVIGPSGFWDIAMARYNTDGTLDTSFDSDGRVTTNLGYDYNDAYSVTVQNDGKILVGGTVSNLTGYSNGGFALARYNSDGSLDPSFDGTSNNPPSGTVTISDTTPTQKQLLTAFNDLADIDGLGTITYQWKADSIAITGATNNTFTPTQAQVNKTLTVTASYIDGHGNAESVTSTPPTLAVANVNDLPTGTVTISGIAKQGEKLTASNNLVDLDGLGTITYQWEAGGIAISGATADFYYLTHAELGKSITVTARYTDGFGASERKSSAPTAAVIENFDPVTITGGSGADKLEGASGNDELHGLLGNDTLWGYEGNDALYGEDGKDFLYGQMGDDYMEGGTGNDFMDGGDGNDFLVGGTGIGISPFVTDILIGGMGDDTLDGGNNDHQTDSMDGGAGNDTYFIYGTEDIIADSGIASTDIDTVIATLLSSYTLAAGIENGKITGNAASLTGNGLNNFLTGDIGDDTLMGGLGNDTLYAASGNDTVDAGSGNDEIVGGIGYGNDFYIGGTGKDTITYKSAITGITVNLTTGIASGNEIGTDTLRLLPTDAVTIENITGGIAGDNLTGNAGNNVINGYTGADTMIGDLGNDTYVINVATDRVTELTGQGTDTIQSTVRFSLLDTDGAELNGGNVENLQLLGKVAINGTGNALPNVLIGNAAANILNGLKGNDTLTGGAGADIFQLTTAGSIDTITDFSVVDDTVQLENAIFTKLTATGALATGVFRSGAGISTAVDTNDYLIYNTTDGKLYYDADASLTTSAPVQIALIGVTTHAALTAADFAVI